MGATAEFNNLSNSQRLEGLRIITEEAKKCGMTVCAHVSGDTPSETLANIREVENFGVDYIVLALLYYLESNEILLPILMR